MYSHHQLNYHQCTECLCACVAGNSWDDITQMVMTDVRRGPKLQLKNNIDFMQQTFRSVKHFPWNLQWESNSKKVYEVIGPFRIFL